LQNDPGNVRRRCHEVIADVTFADIHVGSPKGRLRSFDEPLAVKVHKVAEIIAGFE